MATSTSSDRGRTTASLAAGSVLSGLLAYVFFAVATRALGAEAAAPVAVLWSYWGFAAAGLTFPVQHWIARSVAAEGDESGVAAALPRVALAAVGLSGVAGGVAWLAGEPLFGGRGTTYPVLVGVVTLGAGLMGWVRGLLAARGRFGAVGAVLVAENGVRVLVAAALVLADGPAAAYGWALAAGYLACAAWPSAWVARVPRTPGSPGMLSLPPGCTAGEVPTSQVNLGSMGRPRSPLAFLGGAAGGQLVAQVVLMGGPVLLALLDGTPAQVTALFAGLAIYRIPYTLLLGQVAQLTGALTLLVVRRRVVRLRRLTRTIVAATVLGGLVGAAVGAWVGPWVVRLVFGDEVRLAVSASVPVAAASALALGNLLLGVLLLAHARTTTLLAGWLIALLPGLLIMVLDPGGAALTVAWCFFAVEATAAAWLSAAGLSVAGLSAVAAGGASGARPNATRRRADPAGE